MDTPSNGQFFLAYVAHCGERGLVSYKEMSQMVHFFILQNRS
jgi:hypothetical protein